MVTVVAQNYTSYKYNILNQTSDPPAWLPLNLLRATTSAWNASAYLISFSPDLSRTRAQKRTHFVPWLDTRKRIVIWWRAQPHWQRQADRPC